MKNNIIIGENKVLEIETLTQDFLNYIDVSDKTIDTYKIALKQFALYLKENNISLPQREDIIQWRELLKVDHKPTTINGYLIAVRNFFKYLEYNNIYKNITENVKNIQLEQRHLKLGLSKEEIEKVISVCKTDKELLMVKMIINLGLRSNEVVNIRLEDFYKDNDVILMRVLGKARAGYKQDSIKIDERLYDTIKQYVINNNITDYLFTSDSDRNKGQSITAKTVRFIIKDLFKRAELDNLDLKSCHSLRHTTTEMLLENGVSIQEVSGYMRHKSLNTTMIYAKEMDQKKSNCSNLLANSLF